MGPASNRAPLMHLADLDLVDLLPPELQHPKRTSSGVFTRPSPVGAPQRSSFVPGPVGTRAPSQPPALVLPAPKKTSATLVHLVFAVVGFLIATSLVTYFLCR